MSRRFWGSLAMAAGILATVHGTAMTQQQDASAASKIKQVVETCFSPPPGATDKVIVSAIFDADGSLKDKPEVVRKGEGPVNNTFARAAVRAILSCEPRLAGLGLQGKITFNFDPPDVSPVMNADVSEAINPERLEIMEDAARQLMELAERRIESGELLRPSSPEIAKILVPLCNAREAEQLHTLSTEHYKAVSQYIRYVSTVMEVYDVASDAARSQQVVTRYMQELGSCMDTVLWSGRTALEMVESFISDTPGLLEDPKVKNSLEAVRFSIEQVMEGALEAFQLNGIGPTWCEARIKPLVALANVAARSMSSQQKEKLRKSVQLAERCGPASKLGLQPIYRSLEL